MRSTVVSAKMHFEIVDRVLIGSVYAHAGVVPTPAKTPVSFAPGTRVDGIGDAPPVAAKGKPGNKGLEVDVEIAKVIGKIDNVRSSPEQSRRSPEPPVSTPSRSVRNHPARNLAIVVSTAMYSIS